MVQDQITQAAGSFSSVNKKQFASVDVQTSLHGGELEALLEFREKHLETQSKFEVKLR